MSKKVIVLIADGFEEMEAIISIDILRRAGLDVISAAVKNDLQVTGSRNIVIQADSKLEDLKQIPDAVVLPGGGKGAKNLAASTLVEELIIKSFNAKKLIAAICASPACVLAKTGILKGKNATGYPGTEGSFGPEVTIRSETVVVDENIITSAGPGTAFDFALAIVEKLCGEKTAQEVQQKALIS